MSAVAKRHTRSKPRQDHSARLLAILEQNLAQATSPALRERLQAAITVLKERKAA
jgi:hypothetical protein